MEIKINTDILSAMHIVAALETAKLYHRTQLYGDKDVGDFLEKIVSEINEQMPPLSQEQYDERQAWIERQFHFSV